MNLEEAYEIYFPKVYNFIYYRVLHKQDAEDITSAVFIKVAKHFDAYDPDKGSLSSWIFKIADNTLLDHFRSNSSKGICGNIDELPDAALSVDFEGEARLIKDEALRELYMALSQLDGKTREIIAMKYFWEKTIRQIATEKQMNESTVSTMHNRGLDKLRKSLHLETRGMTYA